MRNGEEEPTLNAGSWYKTYAIKGQEIFVREKEVEAVGGNFWGTGRRSGEAMGMVRSLRGDCWSTSSESKVAKDVSRGEVE
jgi:hypothetical protein